VIFPVELLLWLAYVALAAVHVIEWYCRLIERRITALQDRVKRRRGIPTDPLDA
jgi:hypothetical protein